MHRPFPMGWLLIAVIFNGVAKGTVGHPSSSTSWSWINLLVELESYKWNNWNNWNPIRPSNTRLKWEIFRPSLVVHWPGFLSFSVDILILPSSNSSGVAAVLERVCWLWSRLFKWMASVMYWERHIFLSIHGISASSVGFSPSWKKYVQGHVISTKLCCESPEFYSKIDGQFGALV